MSDGGLNPAGSCGDSPLSPCEAWAAGLEKTPGAAGRIQLIDHRAIDAALGIAAALRMHVAGTSRISALRDLADLHAAHGICSHAYSNIAHSRTGLWLITWERLTLDAAEVGTG
jgi:hypothetical protein